MCRLLFFGGLWIRAEETVNRAQETDCQKIPLAFLYWFICEIHTFLKNSPPRRTRRGPPLFEKRSVPGFGLLFCADLFFPIG